MSAKPMKFYVGIKNNGNRNTFKYHYDPTESDLLPYKAVIGPFKTLRGARFMACFGANNPHCQSVDDAERLAKKHMFPFGGLRLYNDSEYRP